MKFALLLLLLAGFARAATTLSGAAGLSGNAGIGSPPDAAAPPGSPTEWWDNRTADFAVTGALIDTWTGRLAGTVLTGTTTTRPTLIEVASKNYVRFDTDYFDLPAGFTIDRRASSLYIVFRIHSQIGSYGIWYPGAAGTLGDSFWMVNQLLRTWNVGGSQSTGLYASRNLNTVYRIANGATNVKVGANSQSGTTTANASGTVSGGWVGAFNGHSFDLTFADIMAILIYPTTHSDAEREAVQDWMTSKYTATSRSYNKLVLFPGDSITAGSKSTDLRYYSYPDQLARLPSSQPIYINLGIVGARIDPANANPLGTTTTTTQLTNFAGIGTRTIVLLIGRNDCEDARTAVQIEGDISSWITTIKAADASVKIVLCTIIASVFSNQSAENAVRLAVNSTITGAGLGQDYTVDLAADARLSNYNDTTYYDVDGIHLNDAGYAVIASLVNVSLVANNRL